MFYLILAFLASALVSILMRLSENYRKNNLSMLAANYAMCSVMAACFTGPANLFPTADGFGLTLLLGAIGGVCFLGSFMLLQFNIHKNGVVLPTTFMKLGIIIPTLMSVLVFGEKPRLVQAIGIIAAIAAIILMQGKGSPAKSTLLLVMLLVTTGFSNSMSKIFEEIGPSAFSDQFLFYIFFTALVLCACLCILKKQKICLADVLCGFAIGIPNYLSSRFMLLSLAEIPAVIAYPTYSVASIVIVALVGVIFFREKLNRRKIIALGIILAALVLLNV